MENEKGLKRIEKWSNALVWLSILFAIVTFILYATLNGQNPDDYVQVVARFWASLSITVFLVVISITAKVILRYLVLINNSK